MCWCAFGAVAHIDTNTDFGCSFLFFSGGFVLVAQILLVQILADVKMRLA